MFYNPLTGKILEYEGNQELTGFIKRLQSPRNLYVLPLTSKELANPSISRFVSDMREHFMGDIIAAAPGENKPGNKPFQMMPILKVHKDADVIKKSPEHSVGDAMMRNLVELSIYLNNDCGQNCPGCSTAFKQFLCCTRAGSGKKELDIPGLADLFRQVESAPLLRVNILGGDLAAYTQLHRLPPLLASLRPSMEKIIYIHYLNLGASEKIVRLLSDSCSFAVPVTFPVDKEGWNRFAALLNRYRLDARVHFIVSREEDIAAAEELIQSIPTAEPSFSPFYDGTNTPFFRDNVFLDKDDITEDKPARQDIYARQLINPFNFGKLTVMSNGNIYANVNQPRLGNLNTHTLHEAVYKEMFHGKSWRRTRKKVNPCKSCNFQALCPPLSNYEYALKRNNLCHIHAPGE